MVIILDVVFTIFDDNGDEMLSSREFISVLKERAHTGLDISADTGFVRLIIALGACVVKNCENVTSSDFENYYIMGKV